MNEPLPIGTPVLVSRKLGSKHVATLIQAKITGHRRRGGMLDYMVRSSPGGDPWVCNSRKVTVMPGETNNKSLIFAEVARRDSGMKPRDPLNGGVQ